MCIEHDTTTLTGSSCCGRCLFTPKVNRTAVRQSSGAQLGRSFSSGLIQVNFFCEPEESSISFRAEENGQPNQIVAHLVHSSLDLNRIRPSKRSRTLENAVPSTTLALAHGNQDGSLRIASVLGSKLVPCILSHKYCHCGLLAFPGDALVRAVYHEVTEHWERDIQGCRRMDSRLSLVSGGNAGRRNCRPCPHGQSTE